MRKIILHDNLREHCWFILSGVLSSWHHDRPWKSDYWKAEKRPKYFGHFRVSIKPYLNKENQKQNKADTLSQVIMYLPLEIIRGWYVYLCLTVIENISKALYLPSAPLVITEWRNHRRVIFENALKSLLMKTGEQYHFSKFRFTAYENNDDAF